MSIAVVRTYCTKDNKRICGSLSDQDTGRQPSLQGGSRWVETMAQCILYTTTITAMWCSTVIALAWSSGSRHKSRIRRKYRERGWKSEFSEGPQSRKCWPHSWNQHLFVLAVSRAVRTRRLVADQGVPSASEPRVVTRKYFWR